MESLLIKGGVVALCVGVSFLLSGMEAGLSTLSRLRIRQQRRAGRYAARVLQGYLDNSENFLWTILIGNTLATLVVFSMLVIELYRAAIQHPVLIAAVFLVVAFLFYVLCDLLPKMFFRQFPNRLCLSLAIPFRFIHLILAPLVWLITGISTVLLKLGGSKSGRAPLFGTRTELRWVMEDDSTQGLTSEERAMIRRVLDLEAQTVGAVMVPFNRVVSISAKATVKELLDVCRQSNLMRVPVWEEVSGKRRTVGVVTLRSVLYGPEVELGNAVGAYVRPALFLREDNGLEDALQRMQGSGNRLAIVLGRDQQEVGILSLADILRVIFGEVSL